MIIYMNLNWTWHTWRGQNSDVMCKVWSYNGAEVRNCVSLEPCVQNQNSELLSDWTYHRVVQCLLQLPIIGRRFSTTRKPKQHTKDTKCQALHGQVQRHTFFFLLKIVLTVLHTFWELTCPVKTIPLFYVFIHLFTLTDEHYLNIWILGTSL